MNVTTSFKKCLEDLYRRRDCVVSYRFLESILLGETFDINYFALRDTNISFLPKGKEHIVNDDGKWARKGRQEARPGKVAKALFGSKVTDHDLEKFNNYIKSYVQLNGDDEGNGKAEMTFVRVWGDLIYHYYSGKSDLENSGNLGNSCMRHDQFQENNVFELYAKNANCSLLVLKDIDYKIVGRALLWEDGENTYMDTVYCINDVIRERFVDNAIKEKWYYKSNQSCHHPLFDMYAGSKIENKAVSIKLNQFSRDWYVPYLDTVSYIVYKDRKYFLQNFIVNKDFIDGKYYSSRSTDLRKFSSSEISRVMVDDQISYLNRFGNDDDEDEEDNEGRVYSDYHEEYIYEDDCTYVDYEYEGEGYADYIRDDCATYCTAGHMRGNYAISHHTVEVNGSWYIKDDADIVYVEDGYYVLTDDSLYYEKYDLYYDINKCIEYNDELYPKQFCVTDYNGDYIPKDYAVLLSNGKYVSERDLEDYLEDNPSVSKAGSIATVMIGNGSNPYQYDTYSG